MRVRFDKHNLLSFMANEFLQFSNFLKAFQKKIIHLHMHWKPTFAERVSFLQMRFVSSKESRFDSFQFSNKRISLKIIYRVTH